MVMEPINNREKNREQKSKDPSQSQGFNELHQFHGYHMAQSIYLP